MINHNTSPTEGMWYLDLKNFAIQDFREARDIVIEYTLLV